MSTIGKLFGRSPFRQLQTHMEQVSRCVHKMSEAIETMCEGHFESLDELSTEVSRLEHQADQIKNDIRNHLMRRFFLPIDRGDVLEILSMQDALADAAEDVCRVMTFKKLPFPEGVREHFDELVKQNIDSFEAAAAIIRELDELIESGFGGAEGEKIRAMAHDVACAEYQSDLIQVKLLKKLYEHDTNMSVGEFHLWMRFTRNISRLSNVSENLANMVLKTLSLK